MKLGDLDSAAEHARAAGVNGEIVTKLAHHAERLRPKSAESSETAAHAARRHERQSEE
jgi:hypothetical protein